MRIVVDDAPDAGADRQRRLDTDLQILVNGLWAAGAEAIVDQRPAAHEPQRDPGRPARPITVNFRSLRRPYTVTAIGDPDQLARAFRRDRRRDLVVESEVRLRLRFDDEPGRSR